MSTPQQLELCFPSLVGSLPATLAVWTMAQRAGCSEDHIRNLLLDDTIRGGNIGRKTDKPDARQYTRVTREEWTRYCLATFGIYDRRRFLKEMGSADLRELIADANAELMRRGEPLPTFNIKNLKK